MKRTPEQARQTRESLLRAALEVFDRRGVARASLTEIAHEAGVTRGALYWHFKSREELFDALFQRLFSEYSQQLERDIRSGAPDMLGTLRQALLRHFERVERDETICKFLRIVHLKCERTADNAAISALMHGYLRTLDGLMRPALAMCVRQEALPATLDVQAASLHLHALLLGLTHLWLLQPERIALQQQAERTIDAALDAMRTSAALQRRDAP